MPSPNQASIKSLIERINFPPSSTDLNPLTLADAKQIRSVEVDGDAVTIELRFGFPVTRQKTNITELVTQTITAQWPAAKVSVNVEQKIVAHAVQNSVEAIPGVKNVIAVASGKGGVGKSTTTVNLALALAYEGAKVGILDADIYGPSQHTMLGAEDQKPELVEGSEKMIEPIISHGLQSISLGYLVDRDSAMIWRGPMATQALQQISRDTQWHDLDYLFVDMPPGTGDIHLTLAQQIPVSGAVIVTTPQDIALQDASKGFNMFKKVDISVLGLIENMATHTCSNCGHEEHIFGSGGGGRMADEYDMPLLGSLPLDISIREQADAGKPTVAQDPESTLSQQYRQVALELVARLAKRKKNMTFKFGNIAVVDK
ncbi:MAG: iron-sulfur cluster carrier protein ApbC [Immundisolibacteraceae bacterium]|nr:iron-sulfur cluster carrier protein ApbC [Immundisolibacteraceae bacterium]